MRVVGLWRYPVKGLLGEALDALPFDDRGVVGDRRWAVYGADGKIASGKTTRRFRRMPGLFTMSSRTGDAGDVLVTVDGWTGSATDPATAGRIAAVVGEPVTLRVEQDVRHHDEGGVHLLTTAELDGADPRRFRPNVLLDGVDPLRAGDVVELPGGVRLRVTGPMPRCVMTTLAQPAHGLPFEPGLARTTELGVVAEVLEAGTLST